METKRNQIAVFEDLLLELAQEGGFHEHLPKAHVECYKYDSDGVGAFRFSWSMRPSMTPSEIARTTHGSTAVGLSCNAKTQGHCKREIELSWMRLAMSSKGSSDLRDIFKGAPVHLNTTAWGTDCPRAIVAKVRSLILDIASWRATRVVHPACPSPSMLPYYSLQRTASEVC